jgi:hypothetical protein
MQYTIRNIPKPLDQAIRERAKAIRSSINDVTIELLFAAFRALGQPVKRRDLSRFVGTWVEDPAFDQAMKDFEQINPETWGLTDDPNYARHEPVQRPSTRRPRRRRSA